MNRKLKAMMLVFVFGTMAFTFQVAADSAAQPDQSNASAEKATSVQPAPKVVFPQTRYEFEPVLEGAEIKHDFIIENHGEALLVIQNVRPD